MVSIETLYIYTHLHTHTHIHIIMQMYRHEVTFEDWGALGLQGNTVFGNTRNKIRLLRSWSQALGNPLSVKISWHPVSL